ncbi:amino acid/polyamine/organocation transporter, APC superfamily (TC 2.A.3) [Paenibacillus uliginis N3/975]|uniref:Amino acid/polyamine/organocation transporter, APC superfamily (TC 2.A.3) n=1 Tax=Paenibacillus uliginis N3/975 TaxID=1313296 RepID=A0A1X7G9N5_9BACL|nr:amino acid permease [Paenibacillus uliginis]SMF66376.1 amino acid/polyamine/organocation transporter, APC superfamily (TC 2.A.3) [Paenibacillus uliginis N3/975]
MSLKQNLLRKKPIPILHGGEVRSSLKKQLGALDLIVLGVGSIVGTGIFVLTGVTAATHAGPGLILSFLLAGIICAFCALCYAEFASTVPVSGSAYTYSYSTFGEGFAWILGWDLVLEYGFASALVSSSWSGYVQSVLAGFGIHLPTAISSAFNPAEGTYVDVPAIFIALVVAWVISRGAKESTRLNTFMVYLKVGVILLFIGVGVFYVEPDNWTPFMPFGFGGVMTGAAIAFLAYIGFDVIATAAEEVKQPQKNLPIGILGSLAIVSVLYVAVTAVLTGLVPYDLLNVKDPVAFALLYIQQDWMSYFISLGAIAGLTTVLMGVMFGQSRLLYSLGRDGLLPKKMSSVHPKSKSPQFSTWVTGIGVALFSGLVPLGNLADLASIGTLFAFISVSLGIIVLRKTHPDLKRTFRVPFVPWLPLIAIISCVYLLTTLQRITWIGFIVWLVIGIIIYAAYGYRNSRLGKDEPSE